VTLVVSVPPTYAAERAYVLDVVLGDWLGLDFRIETAEGSDTRIGAGEASGELVLADGLFATPESDWLTPASIPPRLEDADPLGTIFFLITRYEEAVLSDRDHHDRFPAAASLAVKQGVLERPLANERAEALFDAMRKQWPRLERTRRVSTVVPTHDVDVPLCPSASRRGAARLALAIALRDHDPELGLRHIRAYGRGPEHDPCNTFDFLLDESERRGLRSIFFFIAGGTRGPVDGRYEIGDPWIRRLLSRVHERGHQIGLHPSYETFRDPARIRSELEALMRVCEEEGIEQERWAARQHYLRWENPTTWRAYEEAGLAEDHTLSFPERAGFRCGSCLPFTVFDLRARRPLRLRERPLVVMDASLLQYEGLGHERALKRIALLRERCERIGGEFTILWHNNRLAGRRSRRLYADALGAV
jgi:hypothetical protein